MARDRRKSGASQPELMKPHPSSVEHALAILSDAGIPVEESSVWSTIAERSLSCLPAPVATLGPRSSSVRAAGLAAPGEAAPAAIVLTAGASRPKRAHPSAS